MAPARLITLADAAFETGESRHLINFLIRDREIPFWALGMAKVLDEEGFDLLKAAIRNYQGKPTSEQPAPRPKDSAKRGRPKKGRIKGRPKGDPVLAVTR